MFNTTISKSYFDTKRLKRNVYMTKGFTLIELMVIVAIIAILVTIAYPSYQQYIIRSNRVAAQSQMMEIANRQQQFLIANRVFADTETLTSSGFLLPPEVSRHYDFDVTVDSSATPPRYDITFTPKSAQAVDGVISLDSAGTKLPANKW